MAANKSYVIMLVLSLAASSAPAFAWNDFGHMTVACVAYQKLAPRTRARVDELLKLNPYYKSWRDSIDTSFDKNMQVFMMAATWADAIKKDPHYSSKDVKDHHLVGPDASRNIGYSDQLRHRYWHAIHEPFSTDGTRLPKLSSPNVLTQINTFRQVLSSDAPDALKSYDLAWLLHLVGDIHQPLHCVTRFSECFPHGDDCGTYVLLKVKKSKKHKAELHAFWDSLLGSDDDTRKVYDLANSLPEANPVLASDDTAEDWVKEGFDYARKVAYDVPIGDGRGPYKLTESYKHEAKTLAKKRVALAGARLSRLLNDNLK